MRVVDGIRVLVTYLLFSECDGRGMRHACVMEDMHPGFAWGNVMEIDHTDDVGVDGRILFKWALKKWDEEVRTGFIWLGMGQVAGWCEHGNEHSGS